MAFSLLLIRAHIASSYEYSSPTRVLPITYTIYILCQLKFMELFSFMSPADTCLL